jgi:nucleotidyltransferase/DNA polymerase involved in DNA repair
MNTLRGFADGIEQTGIDEAFLDLGTRATGIDDAKELALEIKRVVKATHGLTCSIGVGPNKSTAKIASDMQKPDGLTIVPLDSSAEFLAPLPVSAIPGVGKKTQAFLRERRIETIGQLQAVPGKQLIQWFGKTGVWLWGVVHGIEEMPVRPRETPRSLSVERTFRNDVVDFGRVYAEMDDAALELARRAEHAGFRFKVVGVKIRFHAFETYTREKTLTNYTDGRDVVREVARALLKEFELREEPVRLVGVRVSGLEPSKARPSGTLDSWVS